jgi:hypothetical protein|tara:strand:- start:547 stop:999 length:453 start_codon:yes stop_codon:yes gene_type:complete
VETYAKTLGQVAVGVVVVGVGILAIAAVAETGGAGLGSLPIPGGSSKSKKDEKGQKIPLLLCRECVEVSKKKRAEKRQLKAQKIYEEEKALEELIDNEPAKKMVVNKSATERFRAKKSTSDGYCKYIDSLNDKKCKRLEFRDSGYCYIHK